jgi:hypothetical protein
MGLLALQPLQQAELAIALRLCSTLLLLAFLQASRLLAFEPF